MPLTDAQIDELCRDSEKLVAFLRGRPELWGTVTTRRHYDLMIRALARSTIPDAALVRQLKHQRDRDFP